MKSGSFSPGRTEQDMFILKSLIYVGKSEFETLLQKLWKRHVKIEFFLVEKSEQNPSI